MRLYINNTYIKVIDGGRGSRSYEISGVAFYMSSTSRSLQYSSYTKRLLKSIEQINK